MIYVIATLVYFMMALISRGLIVNMNKKENEEEVITGCLSGICVLAIVVLEIWFIGLGLTHLGLII